MSRLYGVSKSAITLAKIIEGGIVEKKDGDFDKIDNFIAAIANGNYNYVSNEIDVDNFIDYMIFESFIGNRDWPKNNVRFFAVDDGPFRFVLFDLDLVATQDIDSSPMTFINHPIDNPITDLFNMMYANEGFKQSYNARFESLMNSGLLSSTRFNSIVAEYKSNIEHIIPTQINKYNTSKTFTEWYINIDHLKSNFLMRENYVR
jgi:spore coat protein CotH